MPAGSFEKVGVQAVVEGFGRYMQDLGKMEAKSKGFGGALRGLGKTAVAMGTGFIAAQASIAGVQTIMSKSIGAAMAYEAQMAQIRALTGASSEDTDLLTVAIRDMATAMPKSPAELGSAAYFILSSGIEDAADAADVLEVSAKASTIGLGETEGVANALTTVLNAYGKSAGEAGQVTDVMIEAVKQGKAEASEFAGVLGRVVPLAAQMGISFEEVAANLATFTRLGVSADEAATGLRQVMASLLKPTVDQEEAMEELGFSAEGLRQQIKDKGLLATLDEMITATGGNEAAVAKLFPNIRALTSVLGTAGVQMDAYTDILGATSSATGNLDEGFAIVADTAKFKLGLAMNELNLALMDLGTVALPIVVRLAEKLSDLISELEGFVGPAGDVAEATNIAADSAERADTSFSLWDAVMAGATLNLERFKKEADDAAGLTSLLSEEIDQQLAVLEREAAALAATGNTTHDAAEETSEFDARIAALSTRLGISEQALRDSGLSIEELRVRTAGLSAEIARSPAAWQTFDDALARGAALGLQVEAVLAGVATEAAGAARTIPELAAAFTNLAAAVMGANSALQAMAGGFAAIAGQRTAETLALDIEINALEQEQNAAQQAGIGQQSYGGAVESTTSAIDEQIKALENQAAALIPEAIEAEVIALEYEATVLELLAAEIEGQILARQDLLDAYEAELAEHEAWVAAVQAEIDARDREIDALRDVTEGIDEQIQAQQNLIDSYDEEIAAVQAEIDALDKEADALGDVTEGIDEQIQAQQDLIDSYDEEIAAVEAEIDALDKLINSMDSAVEGLDRQIAAEKKLTKERAGTLPHSIKLNKLELAKEKLLQKVGGETEDLTDAEQERLKEIERAMDAERRAIRIKKLEAEATELQAQKSGKHLKALEAEKAEIEAQIAKTEALKKGREDYIDTLVPPELFAEIEALKDQKAEVEAQIEKIEALKEERGDYIETLVPPELQQEIEALKDQKAEVEAQIAKVEALKKQREDYIDTLVPPEVPKEIEDLKTQKEEIEAQIAKVRNLKDQRELYIKTLMPPELQQEIKALQDEKAALDDATGAAGGLATATGGLTTALDNQIAKLNLEREAIDLVTKGWELQGKKILELPTIPDILNKLKGYKALLMLDLQKEMMDAFKVGDFPRVAELAGWIAKLGAITFAQHGFHGDVTRPTMFVAGEAGKERVDISPPVQRDTVLAPQALAPLGFDRLADLLTGRSGGMSISVSAASQEQIAEEVGRTWRGLAFELGRAGA